MAQIRAIDSVTKHPVFRHAINRLHTRNIWSEKRVVMRFLYVVLIFLSVASFISKLHADSTAPQKVNLRLTWKHQFQFAGYYAAREKGFYREQGLDVDIFEFTNGINNMNSVLNGETDFAVGRSSILVDKSQGKDIVALFAAFQSSPFMLLTRAFTGISQPEDLKGKRVMVTGAAARSGELLAMLAYAGLRSGDFIRQQHSFNINDLIDDNTDAMASYTSNEPYALIKRGIPYNIIHPSDYGFKMYADILYTSGDKVQDDPKLVHKFYNASIEGWKYAFANMPEIVALIREKYNSQNRSLEALLFEAQELKRLAFDSYGNFGTLLPERFQSMSQVYLIAGAIQGEPNLDNFIYKSPSDNLNLSYDELELIKSQRSINACVYRSWPPFEQLQDERFLGIIVDILNLIRDKSGLSINLVPIESTRQGVALLQQGACDLITAPQAIQKYFDLLVSEPVLNTPLAYLVADTQLSAQEMNRRVAILSHTPCEYCIVDNLPETSWIKSDSLDASIQWLAEGKVSSIFGSEAHLRYKLSLDNNDDLTLLRQPQLNASLGFATLPGQIRLNSILNKAIATITRKERDRILGRWIVFTPVKLIPSYVYWVIIAIILSATLYIIYKYYLVSLRQKIFKELSETDALTGVANRRRVVEELGTHINLSNRYGTKLAVIFFDIDNFKQVNDLHGHETGDWVLREISQLVTKNIRRTDIFGRWGGEEFIIIGPESNHEDGWFLAEALRQKIAQHNFKIEAAITCSFGITEHQADESLDHIIKRADDAMYEAKKSGKNRCVRL